jgi:hypothetical protein
MSPATSDVLLYQSPDGQIQLDVQLDHDTVWLTQSQMSELFSRERSVISKHLRNIFQTEELDEESNVQKMHIASADRPVALYSLEVIISVGYRVNSIKGVRFRQWATQVLRQYLVQGYALNEKRLRESQRQLADLKRLVQLQAEVAASQELTADQSDALLRILGDYARALDVLDQYDHQRLRVARDTVAPATDIGFELTYESAIQAINALRGQFGGPSCLDERRISHSKARYALSTRALAGRICTLAWRKRQPTYFIS